MTAFYQTTALASLGSPRRRDEGDRKKTVLSGRSPALKDHSNLATGKLSHIRVCHPISIHKAPRLYRPAPSSVLTHCDREVAPVHARAGRAAMVLQSKRVVIESRWVSKALAFAGTLRGRRLKN